MERLPVILGEVLFDCFGDLRTLGGAPFNVAWHLQGFGLRPCFISRVGDDALGKEALFRMRDWGMDTRWVQTDTEHPTGQVTVQLDDGQPTYDILPSQAYDYIQVPEDTPQSTQGIFYHGSLAARSGVTRATILGMRQVFRGHVFLDVNLRSPWWSSSSLDVLVNETTWLKLNQDEAGQLAPQGDVGALARTKQIDRIILTEGGRGASLYGREGRLEGVSSGRVSEMVDTVGAGDAFSAVALMGLIQGWDWSVLLRRAADFAALSCGWRGALSDNRVTYQEVLRDWNETPER